PDALIALLDTLTDTDLGIDGTGYTAADLAALLPTPPLEVAEPTPLPTVTTAMPGDIWQVGPHRVGCGDATDPDFTGALIGGASLEAIITDPPYGVDYHGVPGSPRNPLDNDATSTDSYRLVYAALTLALANTNPGGAIYLFGPGGPNSIEFSRVMADLNLWRQQLVWVKDRMVMGRSDYHYIHEPIWYGWTPGAAHRWYSDRKQTTVLNHPRPARSNLHPTMKPPELIAQLLTNSTLPGDTIYDPFAGSGTTAAVAHTHNRTAITCDIEPAYTDVTVARLLATDPTLQATHTTTGAVWTPAETP
ncbi:site-specific DNA-methyltransferase, partial [Mycolicibacterium sp.]|uniref:DNA-methyltransferase n=1 Tax=Mycolicibacterium sp. TaxID=2320850 RepID=UPI00355F682F